MILLTKLTNSNFCFRGVRKGIIKKREALPRDDTLWIASHRDSNITLYKNKYLSSIFFHFFPIVIFFQFFLFVIFFVETKRLTMKKNKSIFHDEVLIKHFSKNNDQLKEYLEVVLEEFQNDGNEKSFLSTLLLAAKNWMKIQLLRNS